MKIRIINLKQRILMLAMLCCGISSAQQVTIELPAIKGLEAALKAQYSDSEIADITDLKVTTPAGVYLGPTDQTYLNSMPRLARLDLSEAVTTSNDDRAEAYKGGFSRQAFSNNASIKTFIFPQTTTSIDRGFFHNSALEGILTLPRTLAAWASGEALFAGNRGITGFEVEAGNTKLKVVDGILYSLDGATLLVYPYGKTNISYSIPEGVTTLNTSAFGWNDYLEELSFPASLVNLPAQDKIVNNSTKIKRYNVAAGNPKLASTNGFLVDKTTGTLMAFPPGNTDETIVIDGSVVKIVPSGYFSYAVANLKNIIFTEGVETIGYVSFKIGTNVTSKLEYVELPSTLKNIDGEAFVGNKVLKQVICKATTPPTLAANQIFRESNGTAVRLGVPASALAAYKASTWNISVSAGTNAFPEAQIMAYNNITMVDASCIQSASVAGYPVSVVAGAAPEGQAFSNWTSTPAAVFANSRVPITSFTMPASDITVRAVFANKMPYTIIDAVTPSGTAAIGSTVNIVADAIKNGNNFSRWEVVEGAGVVVADPKAIATSFTMIDGPVTIAARYAAAYTITICGGYAPLEASQGETVTIKASKSANLAFTNWTTTTPGVTFSNANSETATFVMPASTVNIEAHFQTK